MNQSLTEAINLCAGDNQDARAYLWTLAEVARAIDDGADGDHGEVDPGELMHNLLASLPANQFFSQYRAMLIPAQVIALNAWLDANEWEKSGCNTKYNYAMVIRDQINEIGLLVAYLVGGWRHMRNVSLKVRELFLKEEFRHGDV